MTIVVNSFFRREDRERKLLLTQLITW